jgi:hypothetical protein
VNDYIGHPLVLTSAGEIVLWLGTSVSQQLMLAWMPQLLRSLGIAIERLRFVQVTQTARGKPLASVCLLNADEFRAAPAKQAVNRTQRSYLERVWAAVTAAEPSALLKLFAARKSPLPLLTAALQRVLWRYPDIRTGVNRYEARLLADTPTHGPCDSRVIVQSLTALNGIDDWVGGVHLDSRAGNVWYHKDGTLVPSSR